eukprot:3739557-Pleurochrysis_carterae.AAC.1
MLDPQSQPRKHGANGTTASDALCEIATPDLGGSLEIICAEAVSTRMSPAYRAQVRMPVPQILRDLAAIRIETNDSHPSKAREALSAARIYSIPCPSVAFTESSCMPAVFGESNLRSSPPDRSIQRRACTSPGSP